jgi:hypothetical protein
MSNPTRSYSVFSDEDFKLLKEAVRHWIQTNEESELTSKYANLSPLLIAHGQRRVDSAPLPP